MTTESWRPTAWRGFASGALAGLVVVALILPASGDGFLGLNGGPTTPLIWGVLFAVYGAVLQLGSVTPLPHAADPGRRRAIGAVPLAIGAVSLAVLAWRLLPDWSRAIFNPPEAGLRWGSPE